MDRQTAIAELKAQLLRDVAEFCDLRGGLSREPVLKTLRNLGSTNMQAVFLGGTLRSLVLARLRDKQLGRPRDLDIVVGIDSLDELREEFRSCTIKETRFGGIQVRGKQWHFDIWPLNQTWAFHKDVVSNPSFEALPSTTFFNVEAIAVDVWTGLGGSRAMYSGDDQFFEGILSETLEINLEANPFLPLCIVRAFVLASSLGFRIGPRLACYLVENGPRVQDEELEEAQQKHYGQVHVDTKTMREWLDHVASCYCRNSSSPIALPILK